MPTRSSEILANRTFWLPNENLDSGAATIAGKYKGADEAYAKLVGKLADCQFAGMKPDLRQNILAYYKDFNLSAPAKSTKKERKSRIDEAAG